MKVYWIVTSDNEDLKKETELVLSLFCQEGLSFLKLRELKVNYGHRLWSSIRSKGLTYIVG